STPLPEAVALVNPHANCSSRGHEAQISAPSPELDQSLVTSAATDQFKELCSAGLAFKLAHAIVKRGRDCGLTGANDYDLRPLLDLVALATIADVVPLIGENRILGSAGLQRLNTTNRPGLVALKRVAQTPAVIGAYEVSF